MAKRKQYSKREKQAYHAGRGYAAGKSGKRVKCKTEKEKQSFRNGVKSVRNGKKKNKSNNGVYRNQKYQNCGYFVDADGVLVKVDM